MKVSGFFSVIVSILCCSQLLNAQTVGPKAKATLNHVAVFVVDLEKSKAFYGGLFQLDTIPDPFHDGKHAWYAIAQGVALHVIQGADQSREYFLNNHICFSVPNTDAFVARLKAHNTGWFNAKGVKGEITTRVDGVKQVWVNDPDGYWIEVNDAKD